MTPLVKTKWVLLNPSKYEFYDNLLQYGGLRIDVLIG